MARLSSVTFLPWASCLPTVSSNASTSRSRTMRSNTYPPTSRSYAKPCTVRAVTFFIWGGSDSECGSGRRADLSETSETRSEPEPRS